MIIQLIHFLKRRKKNSNKKKFLFRTIKVTKLTNYKNKLNVVVKANNVFCTFSDVLKNKTLYSASSEMYKIKATKKKINHVYKKMLEVFMSDLNERSKDDQLNIDSLINLNSTILSITAKRSLLRSIIKYFRIFIKKFINLKKKSRKNFGPRNLRL